MKFVAFFLAFLACATLIECQSMLQMLSIMKDCKPKNLSKDKLMELVMNPDAAVPDDLANSIFCAGQKLRIIDSKNKLNIKAITKLLKSYPSIPAGVDTLVAECAEAFNSASGKTDAIKKTIDCVKSKIFG